MLLLIRHPVSRKVCWWSLRHVGFYFMENADQNPIDFLDDFGLCLTQSLSFSIGFSPL
jgi:hypothetical protein